MHFEKIYLDKLGEQLGKIQAGALKTHFLSEKLGKKFPNFSFGLIFCKDVHEQNGQNFQSEKEMKNEQKILMEKSADLVYAIDKMLSVRESMKKLWNIHR